MNVEPDYEDHPSYDSGIRFTDHEVRRAAYWNDTPGARSKTIVREYLESGPWWTLRPAPHLLVEQPGHDDPRAFVAVAGTPVNDWTAAYLPVGGRVRLRLPDGWSGSARWFDPLTGQWRAAAGGADPDGLAFEAPDGRDWILDLRG